MKEGGAAEDGRVWQLWPSLRRKPCPGLNRRAAHAQGPQGPELHCHNKLEGTGTTGPVQVVSCLCVPCLPLSRTGPPPLHRARPRVPATEGSPVVGSHGKGALCRQNQMTSQRHPSHQLCDVAACLSSSIFRCHKMGMIKPTLLGLPSFLCH